MIRKIVVVGLLATVGWVVASRLHLISYAQTLWCQIRDDTKNSVPIEFEIKRLRGEIVRLDDDINKQLKPIAEHMTTVEKLEKDVTTRSEKLADQKIVIMKMVDDLKANPEKVYYDKAYSASEIRAKLKRDFESYKKSETFLRTQVKLLAAKQQTLQSAKKQFSKLMTKKREFTVRLAQFEAQAEHLRLEGMATNLKVDDSRATKIAQDLRALEHRLSVKANMIKLTQNGGIDDIPILQGPSTPNANIDAEVRQYFEPPALTTATTASNNKE